MELYEEILLKEFMKRFPVPFDPSSLVHDISYQTLQQIKAIIEDERLDDPECFMRIENIIRCFEEIGSNGGFRHDFG